MGVLMAISRVKRFEIPVMEFVMTYIIADGNGITFVCFSTMCLFIFFFLIICQGIGVSIEASLHSYTRWSNM